MNTKFRLRWFAPIIVIILIAYFADRWRRPRIEFSQDRNIIAASRKYRVEPALVKAVVWKESRFNPDARGRSGELGLMQIMPDTAADWAGAQRLGIYSDAMLLDSAKNIDCGTWYLGKLLGRYLQTDDPVPYALADYNAGRANVLKWLKGSATTNSAEFIGQIGFPSTQQYVRDVLERRRKYQHSFPSARN